MEIIDMEVLIWKIAQEVLGTLSPFHGRVSVELIEVVVGVLSY